MCVNEIYYSIKPYKYLIYGDKENLYKDHPETTYPNVRAGDKKLNLDGLESDRALARLVGFIFDCHRKNPNFILLIMIENIFKETIVKGSKIIQSVKVAAIKNLSNVIVKDQNSDVFRDELDVVELHWKISMLSFFNVSKGHFFYIN